ELVYSGADNAEHRPVMIHRALMGSYERFIGILLEHLGGELPVWLAPVQGVIIPISDRHNDYANEVASRLTSQDLRVERDERSESVGRKVRDAELRKIPYMLVVGDREQETDQVSVRKHHSGDEGSVTLDAFAERLQTEVQTRSKR
ncbi:MAG: threonine--tRNA ligase, partial [Solirubrobacterales bacterium]|nr:threonine--tRNA ligase [Solirubrobacterales bacterium]